MVMAGLMNSDVVLGYLGLLDHSQLGKFLQWTGLIMLISACTCLYKMLQRFSWTFKFWNGWSSKLPQHCRHTKYSLCSAPLAADTDTEHTGEGLPISVVISMPETHQIGEITNQRFIRCSLHICLAAPAPLELHNIWTYPFPRMQEREWFWSL